MKLAQRPVLPPLLCELLLCHFALLLCFRQPSCLRNRQFDCFVLLVLALASFGLFGPKRKLCTARLIIWPLQRTRRKTGWKSAILSEIYCSILSFELALSIVKKPIRSLRLYSSMTSRNTCACSSPPCPPLNSRSEMRAHSACLVSSSAQWATIAWYPVFEGDVHISIEKWIQESAFPSFFFSCSRWWRNVASISFGTDFRVNLMMPFDV